jgi:pimeloyl-ACP methyl ester carboxylesterase
MIFYYHTTPIHYQKHGNGPAIILLHGFLESSTMWSNIAPVLSKKNTVITIDFPGFGKSDTIADTHSMELLATITSEILNIEKVENAVLIGHSMGGYVSLAFAALFPKKTQKLILLNSSPYQESNEGKKNRNRVLAVIDKNKDAFVNMAINNLFTNTERLNHTPAIEALKKEALQITTVAIKAAITGMRDRTDKMAMLKNFEGEKYILSGRLDNITPHNEIVAISKETETTLHTIESGHMSWLTNWNDIINIVNLIT